MAAMSVEPQASPPARTQALAWLLPRKLAAATAIVLLAAMPGLAGCSGRPAGVEGQALDSEVAAFGYNSWSPDDYNHGWVRVVTSPEEAETVLAETSLRDNSGFSETTVTGFPEIPSGHTALLFYPTYLPDSCYGLDVQGVYANANKWTLAVRIEDRHQRGWSCATALVTSASLLLVDAPPPAAVDMRVERERPGEESVVSWW
jgi:hypothetical protein